MKRYMALLLALVLALGLFAGCGKEEKKPAAQDTPVTPSEPPQYEETEISFQDTAVKTYGRTYANGKGIACNWPASGVEFVVSVRGDVYLDMESSVVGYLQVYVDGKEGLRPRVETGKKQQILVAENLEEGEHTIRILRDFDSSRTGGNTVFNGVKLTALRDTFRPAEDKELLIEFVGDSVTSGVGALRGGVYVSLDDTAHSPVHAYSYLTAQELEADWSLLSTAAIGYAKTVGTNKRNAIDLYPYNNAFALNTEEYAFSRQADIVVLALGHNDSTELIPKEITETVKTMVELVKEKNGDDVQIVIAYGMISSVFGQQLEEAAKTLGLHCIKLKTNNQGGASKEGALGHPNAAAHAENAVTLAQYLKETVVPLVK